MTYEFSSVHKADAVGKSCAQIEDTKINQITKLPGVEVTYTGVS